MPSSPCGSHCPHIAGPKKCDPKPFKALELFLKRVAFNLGNSASQTEVKIISCIPVDVSDLQHKILCLEKKLEEKKPTCLSKTICSAIVNTTFGDKRSMSAFVDRQCSPIQVKSSGTLKPNKEEDLGNGSNLVPNAIEENEEELVKFLKDNTNKRNGLSKKSLKKSPNDSAQLIFFARANVNALQNAKKPKKSNSAKTISRKYLVDVIRKQYRPEIIEDIQSESTLSSTSNILSKRKHSEKFVTKRRLLYYRKFYRTKTDAVNQDKIQGTKRAPKTLPSKHRVTRRKSGHVKTFNHKKKYH